MSKPAAALRELLILESTDFGPVAMPSCTIESTPNKSSRGGVVIDTIVLHCTAGANTAGAVSTLKDPDRGASAHIVIPRFGQNNEPAKTVRLVPDDMKAWHVRKTLTFQGRQDINARSLGIEIVNTAMEDMPYLDKQVEEVISWCKYWCTKHPIKYIVTHAFVDKERRSDPCVTFPWAKFVEVIVPHVDNPTNKVLKVFVKGKQVDADAEIHEGATWAELKPIVHELGLSIKFDPDKFEVRIG